MANTEQGGPTGFPVSNTLYERALKSLAGGVSSQFRAFGAPHPMFYDRAEGARIWDADGNELLDFTLSQGPCILGHSHPELVQRVTDSLSDGQLFAGQHLAELELAETLAQQTLYIDHARRLTYHQDVVHVSVTTN